MTSSTNKEDVSVPKKSFECVREKDVDTVLNYDQIPEIRAAYLKKERYTTRAIQEIRRRTL